MARTASTPAALLVTVGSLALLLQGCEPASHNEELKIQMQRDLLQVQQALQQETARCRLEVAALRAELHAFQESQKQLYAVIDDLRHENDARAHDIEKLCSLVASLDPRVSTPDSAWRNEMMAFRGKLELGDRQRRGTGPCDRSAVADEMVRNLERLRGVSESDKAAARPQEYTVQRYDTVRAIAQGFGVTVDALRNANDLKGDVIRVGQRLKIPPP